MTSRILEPRVAGTAMSSLCRVFARINPHNIYRSLIPHIIEFLENYFNENDDVFVIEKQNDDFLYYITILCSLVRGHPIEIQEYIDSLIPIIDKLLKCKCKTTSRMGTNMIGNLLTVLSVIQTNDVKTVPNAFSKPLSEFLPVRYWGKKMDREEKIEWFMPGEKERAICEKLIHYYLVPIMQKFQRIIDGLETINRDDMLLNLYIISAVLKCNNFLKNWDEEPVKLIDTITEIEQFSIFLGFENLEILMPNGMNVRKALVELLDKLQITLLRDNEDDIKSIKQLLNIWEKVHLRVHSNSQCYDSQMKNYYLSKQFQEYKLCKVRKDIRAVVATRVSKLIIIFLIKFIIFCNDCRS